MLPMCILSKYNIRPSNGILFQWLNISLRRCSSSSDSSDSDSDTEKVKQKKTDAKSTKRTSELESFLSNMIQETASFKIAKSIKNVSSEEAVKERDETKATATTGVTNLTEYMNNMIKARKLEKTINVAIQPRKKLNNTSRKIDKMPYEKKLKKAAEDVATMLGGDQTKTTSDLLEKYLTHRTAPQSITKQLMDEKIKTKPDESSMQFTSKMRRSEQLKQIPEHERQESSTNTRYSAKKLQTLMQQHKQESAHIAENSVSQQLLKNIRISTKQPQSADTKTSRPKQDIDLWNGQSTSIFENMGVTSPNTPELKTWTALEQKELKAFTTYPPANIFQELILWTEQGKLWKFPIDNEQGMEEEHNVHFSDHVFLERHLKGWCPKAGPIRHYMELVCVGLSKNPYLTVQEKINHIMWYKEYFESKEDILRELGAIPDSLPDTVKEIEK